MHNIIAVTFRSSHYKKLVWNLMKFTHLQMAWSWYEFTFLVPSVRSFTFIGDLLHVHSGVRHRGLYRAKHKHWKKNTRICCLIKIIHKIDTNNLKVLCMKIVLWGVNIINIVESCHSVHTAWVITSLCDWEVIKDM